MFCQLDIERARAAGRAEAETAFNAKVESVIDEMVAQHKRTGYKHCQDYAAFAWARFAKGGSKHPADRDNGPN